LEQIEQVSVAFEQAFVASELGFEALVQTIELAFVA
jgi:hypothetical protein